MNLYFTGFVTLRQLKYFSTSAEAVRVRFAPSPTGLLHLGGLRTALYNFLFAKSQGGKFILRIEDTDQTRLVPGAARKIVEDLEWAGLIPDEGPEEGPFGPYIQSLRKGIYKKEVETLVKKGAAYHCFCTEQRLNLLRKDALRNRQIPKYDNRCRHLCQEEIEVNLASGKSHCIRFKLTSSEPYFDLVYGKVLHEVEEVEGDPVILKADGFPTYHLANVVDDYLMKITHVIRGVEWLPSTNKHLMIYRAFEYKPPSFAHLPLLLNADGSKLSKRHGDVSVESFKSKGIFPRALINFITKAGGGFRNADKHYSLEELTAEFDLSAVNSNSCRLPMDRLPEFNSVELERQISNPEELPKLITEVKQLVKKHFEGSLLDDNLELHDEHILRVLKWSAPRIHFLQDLFGSDLIFLWQKPNYHNLKGSNLGLLESLLSQIDDVEFERPKISDFLKEFANREKVKFKNLMQLMRTALSGLKEGPSVAEMMEILGKEASISRLKRAIIICKKCKENGG